MVDLVDLFAHRLLRVPFYLNVRHVRIKLGARHTYVFIHGVGDTADMWADLIANLPVNVNYIAMDLVGFGRSPKPGWATYNAKMQARSVLRTCLANGIFGPVSVIGHSLGGLVAVEFAKRYPLAVRRLYLCSPPIYDTDHGHKIKRLQQNVLRRLYQELAKNPNVVLSAYALGKKIRIINQSLDVSPETLPAFLASLQTSIVNQDTMRLIQKLKLPITIIDGQFDVLTVNVVLREIVERHDNMTLVTIPAGHIINQLYQAKIIELLAINHLTKEKHLQGG